MPLLTPLEQIMTSGASLLFAALLLIVIAAWDLNYIANAVAKLPAGRIALALEAARRRPGAGPNRNRFRFGRYIWSDEAPHSLRRHFVFAIVCGSCGFLLLATEFLA